MDPVIDLRWSTSKSRSAVSTKHAMSWPGASITKIMLFKVWPGFGSAGPGGECGRRALSMVFPAQEAPPAGFQDHMAGWGRYLARARARLRRAYAKAVTASVAQ
jgi:hypothetical protein